MIYNCKSKTYQKILRRLTPEEMVRAAHEHKCKYWHPDMTKLAIKEERRKKKVEKEQWSSWDDDKAQLYMDTHDFRQKRLLETATDLAKASCPEHERETVEHVPDPNVVGGDFWQMPIEGRKKAINKAKMAIREDMMSRMLRDPDHSPIGPEPWPAGSSNSSYPWLPVPQDSTLREAGAPTGTPFLGAVALIESSMKRAGWELNEIPGETIDQKWFHFIYRTPLSGYENDPFFTHKATSSKDGGNPKDPM